MVVDGDVCYDDGGSDNGGGGDYSLASMLWCYTTLHNARVVVRAAKDVIMNNGKWHGQCTTYSSIMARAFSRR